MKTPRILIEIRGGSLVFIAASKDVKVSIIDHDNMQFGDFSTAENIYSPDEIVSEKEIENYIAVAISQHK